MTEQKKSTFTPGPWTIDTYRNHHGTLEARVFASTGGTIAKLDGDCEKPEANARLIAKAPELFAALTDLYEHCAMVHKHWGDGNNQKEATAAIERGRALLAEVENG